MRRHGAIPFKCEGATERSVIFVKQIQLSESELTTRIFRSRQYLRPIII